jgi:HTH-type transcriptional regulator/antitoxin HigA
MSPSLFQPPFSPDYGSSPGTTLREVLERLGLSQSDLAERTGRPKKTINEIAQGKATITPETALQFERVLGIHASFWLNLERLYQAALARNDERERLPQYIPWLASFPVKELARRGWITPQDDRVELVREVLDFFGVTTPDAWNDVWSQVQRATALRQAKSRHVDFGAVAAWLRKGEIDGRTMRCESYDEQRFRESLEHLRRFTTHSSQRFCDEIQRRCASAGVAVVFVPELPRLRIFGAARWLSADKALIQLSFYYKREDQVWFSFFHEAAHILLHGRRDVFVDVGVIATDKEEAEANRFAQDRLIPSQAYAAFIARGQFSASAVVSFAKQSGIAPGILVGRLQHDEKIGYNHLNHLRKPVKWEEQVTHSPS